VQSPEFKVISPFPDKSTHLEEEVVNTHVPSKCVKRDEKCHRKREVPGSVLWVARGEQSEFRIFEPRHFGLGNFLTTFIKCDQKVSFTSLKKVCIGCLPSTTYFLGV
jgi:hypothetical protein